MTAEIHDPRRRSPPGRMSAVVASNMPAPPARRTVEKVAASIDAPPRAMRVSTELPANATRAAAVHTAVRLSIFIGAGSSRRAFGEPGERLVAILEDAHREELAGRERTKLARHTERHWAFGEDRNLDLPNPFRVTTDEGGDLFEFRQRGDVGRF